jgi:three-Cys-motif partner protein
VIRDLRNEYDYLKKISLIVNDGKSTKVDSVKGYIDRQNRNDCTVEYNNLSADEMFTKVIGTINRQNNRTRNLVFIDPYGYKEINKSVIQNLLQNDRTEIILFLPISQMQRFTSKAMESDLEPFQPLRNFVYSFFIGDHPIKESTVSPLAYIDFVKDALRFDSYYSTSYFLERDSVNYHALFFISSHIFGFNKILEVKWSLDEDAGRGFKQPEIQKSLFADEEKQLSRIDNFNKLETLLKKSLETPKTNIEIYEIILHYEFLPLHANEVFKNWQNHLPTFKVVENSTGNPARKSSFYINWENYRENLPKVTFSI